MLASEMKKLLVEMDDWEALEYDGWKLSSWVGMDRATFTKGVEHVTISVATIKFCADMPVDQLYDFDAYTALLPEAENETT